MAKQTNPKRPTELAENETLNGSNTLPAVIEIGPDKSVQLAEIVLAAFQVSGLTVEAWNALGEPDRDGLLNEAIAVLRTAEEKAAADAKAEAEARAKAEAGRKGPRARQEIRYRGKTYAPGDFLPADIDEKAVDELDAIDAI